MLTDYFDEINELINNILSYNISAKEAEIIIHELEAKYGTNIFPDIEFKKESETWNEEYLKKLKNMNITGACSKEFILHMAEVSEYIARQRRIKLVLAGILMVVVIIVILYLITGENTLWQF